MHNSSDRVNKGGSWWSSPLERAQSIPLVPWARRLLAPLSKDVMNPFYLVLAYRGSSCFSPLRPARVDVRGAWVARVRGVDSSVRFSRRCVCVLFLGR